MKNHKRAYEQYCWVQGKNVVMEETVFHNGVKRHTCKNFENCNREGGCRNEALFALMQKNAVDDGAEI